MPGSYVGKPAKVISKLDDVADGYKALKRTADVVDTVADTSRTLKKGASIADKAKDIVTTTFKYVDDTLELASKKIKESMEKLIRS